MKITLKSLLLDHLKAKVMALVMAVLIWLLAYQFSIETMQNVEVPLTITPPEGWTIIKGPATQAITITALKHRKGASRDIAEALRNGDLSANYGITLKGDEADSITHEIRLNERHFRLPEGAEVRVLDFKPKSLNVIIARKTTRKLPVKLEYDIRAKGYKPDEYNTGVWPATVEVTGPKIALDQAEHIATRKVEIVAVPPNLKFSANIPLEAYVKAGKESYAVNASPDAVNFWISLLPEEGKPKVFKGVPIRLMYTPEFGHVAAFFKEKTVNVTAMGSDEDLGKLKKEDILVWATLGSDLSPKEGPQWLSLDTKVLGPAAKGIRLELGRGEVGVLVKAESPK